MIRRFARAPAPWLGLIVLAALVAGVRHALRFSNYVVMTDELGYMKQAVHIAQTLTPSTANEMWFNSYAQLGPLLFAPAYGLLNATTAFDVSHVLATAAFASTAIPVYMLSRLVMSGLAGPLLASALSVAVPWLGMGATLMTEPVAYTAFAWALVAMSRTVAEPSAGRDVIALAAILLAALARTQLIVLAGALVGAIVVHALLFESGTGRGRASIGALRRAASDHVALLAASALGAIVLAVGGTAVLGSYAGPTRGELVPAGTFAAGREMLSYVAVGVGAMPLALAIAWLGMTLTVGGTRQAHAFASVGVCVIVVILLVAGSFTVRYAPAVNDRYAFFIVPILMVASAGLLAETRARAVPVLLGGLLAALVIGTSDLAQSGPSLIAPSQVIHTVLDGRSAQLGRLLGWTSLDAATMVAILVMAGAVVLAVARRVHVRAAGVLAAASLLGICLAVTGYTLDRLAATQAGAGQAFRDGRDWLDREAPSDEPIGLIIGTVFEPAVTPAVWWDVSFWSKRADRVWQLAGDDPHGQGFVREARFEPATGRIPALDERALLVVSAEERRFALRGARTVAGRNGVSVIRAPRPYRAAWTFAPTREDGVVAVGRAGRLRIYGNGRRGRRTVTATVTTSRGAPRGYFARLAVRGRGRTTPVNIGTTERLATEVDVAAQGFAELRLEVSDPLPGVTPDPQAGLLITNVEVDPV